MGAVLCIGVLIKTKEIPQPVIHNVSNNLTTIQNLDAEHTVKVRCCLKEQSV